MADSLGNSPGEHIPLSKSEVLKNSSEVLDDPIGSLLERLDFQSTDELTEATKAVYAALLELERDDVRLKFAWIEYSKIFEQIIEDLETKSEDSDMYAKGQIAAIIHKALIFRTVGDKPRYVEELDRAEVYAYNKDFNDVNIKIQNEINAIIDTLEMSPVVLLIKIKGEISEPNREFLRDLFYTGESIQDVLVVAFGMIVEEGGDPVEVLTSILTS